MTYMLEKPYRAKSTLEPHLIFLFSFSIHRQLSQKGLLNLLHVVQFAT